MLVEEGITNIEDCFDFYLSVKDGEKNKWNKDFFFNLVGKKNIKFYAISPAKGYLIFSIIYEYIDIIAIATDEDSRNNGVASKLLEKLIDFARKNKVTRITLEVARDNKPAIKLYKKFGFSQIGIRKNYYHKNQQKIDAILMKLDTI